MSAPPPQGSHAIEMSNGTMATEEPASEDSSANASRRLSPKEGRSPTFFTADDSSRGQEGIRLVVYDVSCRIGKKDTLKEVTGVVEPGEFYGVMGPSGELEHATVRASLAESEPVLHFERDDPRFVVQSVTTVAGDGTEFCLPVPLLASDEVVP